jgi:ABC-2 type transport system ATP-binding protein
VADHLALGRHLNPRWDDAGATERIERLGPDPHQRAGEPSDGQRAQLALTIAIAKQPEVRLLDEPVASLDPLARREFLQTLMEAVAERTVTVVLSSHLLADLERLCDHLVVLAVGQVRLAGDVDDLLAEHRLLTGPRRSSPGLPGDQRAIQVTHSDRQTTLLVRTRQPVLDPAWSVADVGLEDLVLAYMAAKPDRDPGAPASPIETRR